MVLAKWKKQFIKNNQRSETPKDIIGSGDVQNIVACHLLRGSKLRCREDIGGELPSMRGPHVG